MEDKDIINLWKKGTPKNVIINAVADDLKIFSNLPRNLAREEAFDKVNQVLLKEYRSYGNKLKHK